VVGRAALVDRLLASRDARIVTIVAPAGYGKTTLMALWFEREVRPTAWLSVDRSDNDPATLLAHIVDALSYAEMAAEALPPDMQLDSDLVISHGVRRVVNALESRGTTGVLMLDHVQSIHSRAAHDVIAELAARLPTSFQLVLATRAGVRLPVSVLRTQGALHELTASDLAMRTKEARTMLTSTGVDVEGDLDDLMSRTEGWPAGLYLAGLAVKYGSPHRPARQVGGNDRFVADYLRSEVLHHLSDGRVSFLTRTSILEQFCGPLCDAVLSTTGSARTIERLEQSNLLVVPLDRTRDWYRYHHLLRDFLQAELHRREPDAVTGLHARASEWFDANGMPEMAISHAQKAGDVDMAARIMSRVLRVTYGQGRADTVFDWLSWFEHTERAGHYPEIAALGALAYALHGDERSSDRWASVLFAEDDTDDLPQTAYVLRAILSRGGTARMRTDAEAARRNGDAEWLAAALGLEGFSHLWEGDRERAAALLARAAAAGERFLAMPAATNALAALAVIAIERDDWASAEQFATRSLEMCRENGLERYLTSGLVFAVATRCAVRRGEIKNARRLLAQGTTIRPRLTAATPGISVQTLLELTKAHIELSDIAGARLMMREASTILAKGYDLGNLPRQYEEIKIHLREARGTTMVGASALTTAELRLLPYLTTHLSFPEIGERLYISRHTVKTQAMSIYRKLGASSRSEAVQRAMEVGLFTT
jgi:LuxR family maltose regulon positive regulatory protein